METLNTNQTNINAPIDEGKTGAHDAISMQDLLYLCLSRWAWFAISIVVCMGIAIWYILTTPPSYTRTESILIKDGKTSMGSSEAEMFADMGMFKTVVNVLNEIETLRSPDLMSEVVRRLNLDVNYTTPGRFHPVTLYGTTLPVNVRFKDMTYNDAGQCMLELTKDGKFTLSDFRDREEELEGKAVSGAVGDSVQTPLGMVVVLPSKTFKGKLEEDMSIKVSKSTLNNARKKYSAGLTVNRKDDKSSVIDLTYVDVSTQRADDVLNAVVAAYNQNWVSDKNQIAVSTSMFISDRLGVIEGELGNVDNDISSYKSQHLLPDINAAANLAMTQASESNQAIKDLNTQVYMARYIRNYVANEANNNELIPVNSGVESLNLGPQVTAYNTELMERNSLVSHSSEVNPLVKEMDRNLAQQRMALVSSIDNQIVSLEAQIRALRSTSGQATSVIASNPGQAKYLLSVERQQKVKEQLYLYLLQKREENELSQAFTAYNTKIITLPDGPVAPTAPRKSMILLMALVIGIAIPLGIIYLREMLNTVVRGRKDLESLTVPFVGELPQAGSGEGKRFLGIINQKAPDQESAVVVRSGSRNIINEAFRVVRTNLEFMVGKRDQGIVIAITSANPGSGKTFVTFNLALALAVKDKRVITIDLDLRKGSQSKYAGSPKVGITNYLAGQVNDINSIIVKSVQGSQVDMIPMGTMPPNPTELLFSSRLQELVDDLRKDYDYIFLDCPPVEIVADAAIINQVADMTIFIVRAGVFDRNMLPEIERMYRQKRYRNLSVLLNGTDGGTGKYGSKYGYRYGYKYGYSYGYAAKPSSKKDK